MYDPKLDLAARRVYVAQAQAFPPSDTAYDQPCEQHDDSVWRFDEAEDKNVCLDCLAYEVFSMAEAIGGYRKTSQEDYDANRCERCGEYGLIDEDMECRSADCTSDRADAAMEDR